MKLPQRSKITAQGVVKITYPFFVHVSIGYLMFVPGDGGLFIVDCWQNFPSLNAQPGDPTK